MSLVYPPSLDRKRLNTLVSEVKDYQITHGSLLKLVRFEDEHSVPARPIGAAVFPTLFPKQCFDEACKLQASLNYLYAAISEDDQWLESVLKDLIESDELIGTLWRIHRQVQQEGCLQPLVMGVFRSDYMLHVQSGADSLKDACIKQVECNHYSVAGGTHGNVVAAMHSHLLKKGAYDHPDASVSHPVSSAMPVNNTLKAIVNGLKEAHAAYGAPKYHKSRGTCVLFIVQPFNVNICDERPIEYGLWDQDVPAFRMISGDDVLQHTELTPTRELLYWPPNQAQAAASRPYEVSVLYMRAAYEIAEYNATGRAARLQLERSRAIKSPRITCHLATLKKVQQALTEPGAMKRFLEPEDAARLAKTYMPIHVLDDSSAGIRARALAMDVKAAANYVLKPSLEGGGHNVFREDIPAFLSRIPTSQWHEYILMQMITPPLLNNYLVSIQGLYSGPVVSELGVFGICMWKSPDRGSNPTQRKLQMVANRQEGWSFKTKSREVDEMSVVKGYGCFDSPLLCTF